MQHFLKFSTDVLPERDRVAIWSDVFGRYILANRLDAIGGSFSQNATLRKLPGLSLASMSCSGFRASRAGEMLADGNDNLNVIINVSGTSRYRHVGREAVVRPHEAVLVSSAEACDGFSPNASRVVMIGVPREAVATMVGEPEAMLGLPLPQTETVRLLACYVQSSERLGLDSPGLAQTFAAHVRDLMVLTMGATRDGAQLARGRGLRAARLAAIKLDIDRSLGNELSIAALGLRYGVTPRYIQKLFESEGTTFTEYVIERRLGEARRMLADPQFAAYSIGDIAFRAGFGDQPYFARSFRRRFGMTPSDAREQAQREWHAPGS